MVYVDSLMKRARTKKWHYNEACHLRADSEEELHAFASRLFDKEREELQSWFQWHKNPRFRHYDLTANMRAKAVAMGAKELNWQESAAQLMGK